MAWLANFRQGKLARLAVVWVMDYENVICMQEWQWIVEERMECIGAVRHRFRG